MIEPIPLHPAQNHRCGHGAGNGVIEAHGSEATPPVAETVGQLVCVCDLDGTVLRSDATLSSCARDGLNRLISAGMGVTIASGRSLQAMRALLGGAELELPVIGLNGALISELSSGRHLLIRALGSGTARSVVAMLTAYDASPLLTTWNGQQDRVHYVEAMNSASDWWVAEKRAYGDPRLLQSKNLEVVAGEEEVVLITGFVPNESAKQVVGELRTSLAGEAIVHAGEHIYCAGWTELQIQHPLADKGHAYRTSSSSAAFVTRPFSPVETTSTTSGCSQRPLNPLRPPTAHSSVLAAATATVATNDEDGVIHWLLSRAGG